nr:MAG TPA: hypothetical protein [Caudoviricetes sp.]
MVQIAADAAHVRVGTSGLIPPEWRSCLPVWAKVDEVSTFAAIGVYYEAIGAMGYIDPEPDGRDAVIGEIAVRLGVKPWQMGHFRHLYINRVETEELINLRAFIRLGAVRNEEDLLAWRLKRDGVGGDPT